VTFHKTLIAAGVTAFISGLLAPTFQVTMLAIFRERYDCSMLTLIAAASLGAIIFYRVSVISRERPQRVVQCSDARTAPAAR